MIDEINKIKKGENLLMISPNDIGDRENFIYTFDHVITCDNSNKKKFIECLNKKDISKIYLLGLDEFYRYILPRIKKDISVCWIFKNSFSDLSNGGTRYTLHSIFEYLDRNLIDSIGCFDDDTFAVLTNAGYDTEKINIILKSNKQDKNYINSIGILSNDFDPNNNFYNQLAALTFVDYDVCKFKYVMRATKNFINDFNLKCEKMNDVNDVIQGNAVNLYVNFTNTDDVLIKKSFNMGVPCIVGNSNFFNKNEYLKEHLVVKRDDDVNEIADKINFVLKNRDNILKEYRKMVVE